MYVDGGVHEPLKQMQKAGGANPVHPSVAVAVFGADNQAAASFFCPWMTQHCDAGVGRGRVRTQIRRIWATT